MRLKNILPALCLFQLLSCSTAPDTTEAEPASDDFAVMAYYVANETFPPDDLPLDKLTHIIYSFSKVIEGEMAFSDARHDSLIRVLAAQRDKYPDLKVMVACGGWGADGFSDAASTAGT